MKTNNIIFAILFVTILYSCASSSQGTEQQFDPAILVGEWNCFVSQGQREANVNIIFISNNDVFEGKLTSNIGDGNLKNIKFDGKNLSFICPLYKGNDLVELKGEAVIENGIIKGTLTDHLNRTGPFSGSKVK